MDLYLSDDAERQLTDLGYADPQRYERIAQALRHANRSGFSAGGFAYIRRFEDGITRYFNPELDVNLYITEIRPEPRNPTDPNTSDPNPEVARSLELQGFDDLSYEIIYIGLGSGHHR